MDNPPFYEETRALFDAINRLDLEALRAQVDDDYGIVDIDPEGKTVVINSMQEWENYMRLNFELMRAAEARLETEITAYEGTREGPLGYSVVTFIQLVDLGTQVIRNECIATVIWKHTADGWKEARWHCSLLNAERELREDSAVSAARA